MDADLKVGATRKERHRNPRRGAGARSAELVLSKAKDTPQRRVHRGPGLGVRARGQDAPATAGETPALPRAAPRHSGRDARAPSQATVLLTPCSPRLKTLEVDGWRRVSSPARWRALRTSLMKASPRGD